MNLTMPSGKQGLRKGVLFSLFATSYTPLFLLIMFRQLSQNIPAFDWYHKGLDLLSTFLMHFGLSIALGVTILMGAFGIFVSLHNIKARAADNARFVIIKEEEFRDVARGRGVTTMKKSAIIEGLDNISGVLDDDTALHKRLYRLANTFDEQKLDKHRLEKIGQTGNM